MKIGFIGTGNMGSALAKGVSASCPEVALYFADASEEKAKEAAARFGGTVSDNLSLVATCDLVFLGVKPQVLPAVLKAIAPAVEKRDGKLTLVSMAAGISLDCIKKNLGVSCPLIRIMPNTPVSVGQGVIVYCTDGVCKEGETAFASLLSKAGVVLPLAEAKIDAASALHGCGPAFAYLFIEALSDGGVKCGLPRELAMTLAAQTVKGAAEMVLKTGLHPGQLKDAVTSPGGTTIEGVRVLEEKGLRGAAIDAVIAAYEKTLSLGK